MHACFTHTCLFRQVRLSFNRTPSWLNFKKKTGPPTAGLLYQPQISRPQEIIEEVWHGIVLTAAATVRERELAFRQARLPVKMGGMGITSMEQVRPAAWVGSWALTWPTLRRLHAPFGSVLITAPTAGSDFAELQQCHGDLLARHERVARVYTVYDRIILDRTRDMEPHFQFHPPGLTPREELLPLTAFERPHEFHEHA